MSKVLVTLVIFVVAVCFAIDTEKVINQKYGSKIDKNDSVVQVFVRLGWKELVKNKKHMIKNSNEPPHTLWPPRVKTVKDGKQYTIMVSYLIHPYDKLKKNLYCHISGFMPNKDVEITCHFGYMGTLHACAEPKSHEPCKGAAKIYAEMVFGRIQK